MLYNYSTTIAFLAQIYSAIWTALHYRNGKGRERERERVPLVGLE